MKSVELYDTTLRDGTQGEGISLSVEDKIKIALRLDQMGFSYIEGGWPGSNPKDMLFFQKIKNYKLNNAKITAFGSTRKPNVKVEEDKNLQALLNSGIKICTIFGKTWDFHVKDALGTSLKENLLMIKESVAYLKANGVSVIFDAEHFFDGYKANFEYAKKVLEAAKEGGAICLVLCDTNGGSLPFEIKEIASLIFTELRMPLGIHCHNDGELAVANSLAGVEGGVTQIQGTINGYGERSGNANLCSIIPNLAFKYQINSLPAENLKNLTALSRYVSEVANLNPLTSQPFVGSSAFAHKGGIHVNAILKNPGTYEHIRPEWVGNNRKVLVSELSGISNMQYKYQEMNLDLDLQKEESQKILNKIKELESQGYQFEGAEGSLELLLRRLKPSYKEPFKVEKLRILVGFYDDKEVSSEAVVKIRVGEKTVHTASEGDGPVNALDNALRKALEEIYPQIKNMQLLDYKVRVLDEKDGTGAVVRVLIESGNGKETWGTLGVSENIIEASSMALVDSMVYGLLKEA